MVCKQIKKQKKGKNGIAVKCRKNDKWEIEKRKIISFLGQMERKQHGKKAIRHRRQLEKTVHKS